MTDKYEITFTHEEAECVIMSEASLAILIQLRDWVQREIDSKTPSLPDLRGYLSGMDFDDLYEDMPTIGPYEPFDFDTIEPIPTENND